MSDGGIVLEWSHGKRRAASRTAGGSVPALTPPEAEDTAPTRDTQTGRFVKGNREYRRRQVKERAKGISTLDPKKAPSWLSPFVAQGVELARTLAVRFPEDPAVTPLLGATVDAYIVYRALLALGAAGDGEALKEARAWLKEYRAAIATVAGLTRELPKQRSGKKLPPWLVEIDDDDRKDKTP